MPQRVSQAELARRLGLNRSTVSRALDNSPEVSPAVRARVRDLAAQLGYHPDPVLQRLASTRWRNTPADTTVAFVHFTPRTDGTPLGDEWIRAGVLTEAARLGWRMDVFNLADYPSGAALGRVLMSRGVQGVLLAPIFHAEAKLDLPWDEFSAVSCGRGLVVPPLHCQWTDKFQQVSLALARVRELGYRRIGLCLFRHPVALDDDRRRLGAALADMRSGRGDLAIFEHVYEPGLGDRLDAWIDAERLDCVIGFTAGECSFVVNGRHAARVPHDLGVATLHVEEPTSVPGLGGTETGSGRAGACAVRLLATLMRANETGAPAEPQLHIVAPVWVDSPYCPPRSPGPVPRAEESLPAARAAG